MKTSLKHTLFIIGSLSISLLPVAANEDAAPPPPPGHETRLLQHLLQMDSQELVNLRQTIERIEKMSPEEKDRLNQRIGKMRDMDPERIESMRKKYEAIPEETRQAMRKRWMEMTPEERDAWREKLRAMTPEERDDAFEENGFLPSRPKEDRKGPPREREHKKGFEKDSKNL
ncbi:MAG: DUF3106 domain-containing protein [Opitutales bacterium]|jgi:hypothetical protein|nr:DUF3106 domain-containing protein [Opitutales bacterium]MDP5079629.1 DUF3106 domain-containing protein [Opitutales bacterium]